MPALPLGVGVAFALLVSVPVLVVGSFGAESDQRCVAAFDANGQTVATVSSAATAGLDATQLRHAATIIGVGRHRQIPSQGIVIALATALQESRLRVYANDGTGDLAADQRGIEASLGFHHDAVGRDHGSLGIFQQQWPWWGSMAELMDPTTSAGIFYDALQGMPGWKSLPVTVAAQTVQKSAYPWAYADDEPLARRLLLELGAGTVAGPLDCPAASAGGGLVQFPLRPGSGYVDRRNFGLSGVSWKSQHTGTDFSVGCGTPVLAAHSGTLRIWTDQPWAGRWLVQVEVAPGRLTTWYAHMQSLSVVDGEWVQAGQVIGKVGQEGNATGCHLHFEVHPSGGGIYEDPINPSTWLARNAGKGSEGADSLLPQAGVGPEGRRVSTSVGDAGLGRGPEP
jgi:murein DD-endopeptidase MepM/ murein hydrolase activator NlpD